MNLHIIIKGPRQSGKTTLARKVCADASDDLAYYTGDDLSHREMLSGMTIAKWRDCLGKPSASYLMSKWLDCSAARIWG
ncbi:MAG TPA: hypothetical protein DCO86_01440 [Spirochaetaceae bacterium]|nr:hypothetical protein [Spirochaetaceae bacterium]